MYDCIKLLAPYAGEKKEFCWMCVCVVNMFTTGSWCSCILEV